MKNPYPITRARRIEMRRKQLGYPTRCFYCPESDIACFEEDHPVAEELDHLFKRVVCRNCHRKLEFARDVKRLTNNGQHNVIESEREALRRYLLLMAEDQETIADVLELPTASPQMTAAALRSTADSLRRKAKSLSPPSWAPIGNTALEWDGTGGA